MLTAVAGLPPIVIVCGPTGVGKTRFAIGLAQRFGGQIVGADSMQIYRHMDIGTAKPTAEERAAVHHHMVDIIEPDAAFDAAAYGRQAHAVIGRLLHAGIPAFVVGGTGLYIKALVYGMFASRAQDPSIRQKLRQQIADTGSAGMHADLAQRDPQSAARIHPNDAYRILRALEVVESTGRRLSDHHQDHGFLQARYRTLTIGLELPREHLYARIEQRVDAMVAAGLLEEVRGLLERGYDPALKSMQSLGYRHMADYIQGRVAWDEILQLLKRDHRRYAKRQMTWFRADPQVKWLAPDQEQAAACLAEAFYRNAGLPEATPLQ
jgi:tRNA dimethylallyltransferase